jgi:glycosyltransferase involved in cell wall biosynthesis
MVSFRQKLAAGLGRRGIQVSEDLAGVPCDAVLVIGGTRQLLDLWRLRRKGVRIVQRLDGMNWLHRLHRTGYRHALRAEYGNWILSFIRSKLADRIVYQSEFARSWWDRVYGAVPASTTVIYNGVDLSTYTPEGPHRRPEERWRILLVEGSLMGGYEMGLEAAFGLVADLNRRAAGAQSPLVELVVVGRVSQDVRERWESLSIAPVTWSGLLPTERIPEMDRSAHLLYSSDVNPACPNSVIEALACGLPVLAFDTGALPELVTGDSGRVVPYGGDPWRLDPPDIPSLSNAALEILANPAHFRRAARLRAESAFKLDTMVDSYLNSLLG